MARDHARIRCAVWRDPEFIRLSPLAQRMYFLLLSQPKLSMCGSLDYTPARWANLAAGDTADTVEAVIEELIDEEYVLVDEWTHELVIRSFVRHDGVLSSPNLIQAMWKAWEGVYSETLRQAVVEELPETAFTKGFGTEKKDYEPPADAHEVRSRNPLPKGSAKGSRKGSATPVPVTSPDPVPEPSSSAGDVDDDDRAESAASLLAAFDLERRNEAKPDDPVGDTDRWLAMAARRRLNLDGVRLRSLASEHPDWTAEDIAAELMAPGTKATVYDEAGRAQLERMERNHLRLAGEYRCEDCEDMGVVEHANGTFIDCPCKFRKSA